MRCALPFAFMLALATAFQIRAEDADAFRDKGIVALKDSQSNPRAIVEAARAFVKAAELYTAAGNEEKSVEMNSFLYWCKKKMSMQDIDAFTAGGEAAVSTKLSDVEKLAPAVDEAQAYFDRAEKFANQNPAEHLLIAIRFFEVADRFKGSDASLKAQDRSLKEQLQATASKSTGPPVAVASPRLAPASSGSQAVPSDDKLNAAQKQIKELFKDDYAKTDAAGRTALIAKLVQQADENKDDPASLCVLLREARNLAVAAGDAAQALTIQKRLRDSFKLDFAAMLADLKRLDASVKSTEPATALAALYESGADDALEADNFDEAVRFCSHVDDMLPQIKEAATKARLKMAIAYAQAMKRDSVGALAALKTLTTKPDDAEANLVAGKFALERGRFEQAFGLLAKGKDAGLSGVAKMELAPPTEAVEQVKLGDGWFACAEKENYNNLKVRMQERAAVWYGNALPALTGLAKIKVEGRLKALPKANAPIVLRIDSPAPLTLARLKIGMSEHNNHSSPFESIPDFLIGKTYTQIVAGKTPDVKVVATGSLKFYVLIADGWWGGKIGAEYLSKLGAKRREEHVHLKSGSGDFLVLSVWEVSVREGQELQIPRSPAIIADRMELVRSPAISAKDTPAVDAKTTGAKIIIKEEMGCSMVDLLPGVSSHTNELHPFQSIPAQLQNLKFTQLVAKRTGSIRFTVERAGKVYVLRYRGSDPAGLLKNGFVKQPETLTNGQDTFEIWVMDCAVGYTIHFEKPAMFAAFEMTK